jgi:hypothetical protein
MNSAEEILQNMIDKLHAALNEITDRNIFYEKANPDLKEAYDNAKAANGGRLLNPPLYPEPE